MGVALGIAGLYSPLIANAQFATGGAGLYRNQIVWFSWGASGANIPQAGTTVVNSFNIEGQFLRVTCGLSGIGGSGADPDFVAYRPGNWSGDGFDDLYNIGGTGTANTLIVGLAGRNNAATATATLTCSATFGPANTSADPAYPLTGLVFADAEQSGNAEYVEATIAGGTWRIIDRFRTAGCANDATVTVTTTGSNARLRFNAATTTCASGPMGVGFMQGVSTAQIGLQGGGLSALAVGVVVAGADRGDAPTTYGGPFHLASFDFTGGAPAGSAAGTTTNYFTGFTLATLTSPATRLGATVDTETVSQSGTSANGDDTAGSDDEDAIAAAANVSLVPGGTHTLSNVACNGPGFVYGYIDFNRDGDFADANERSAVASCTGSSVNLSWTMPAAAALSSGASYLRLRIGTVDNQVNSPTSAANNGEVEDYPITLVINADLSITKTNTPAFGPSDQAADTVTSGSSTSYALVVSNAGPAAADGAALRDPVPTNLTCTSATCGSPTGGAVCPAPAALTIAALQSAAGVTLPTLPASSSLTFTVTCNVP